MHERRRHQRYTLDKNCFLTYEASVGTIIDLGMGGLSCMCLEENECCTNPPEKGADIFCEKAKLYAQGFPIKVLDSTVFHGKVGKALKFRKCHVKFEHLELDQKTHLQEIIFSFATTSMNKPGSTFSS